MYINTKKKRSDRHKWKKINNIETKKEQNRFIFKRHETGTQIK